MKTKMLIASTGFAIFSMFFGSGNLVFPITVGMESEGHYLLAALGILLTGVLVPFLGVLGMLLYAGDIYAFFQILGKKGTFLFSLAALALMGPFGVLARCLTVAHGALLLLFPTVSLPIASASLCLIIFAFSVKKSGIVSILGSFLTPFLLGAIALIAFFGLQQAHFSVSGDFGRMAAFKNGFFQGYQMMDLLAAFFFSGFVINHLSLRLSKDASEAFRLRIFLKASLVGASILSMTYIALAILGSVYAPVLRGVPPQEMLGIIAMESLGTIAAPSVCVAVIFACLTTAIVLASLFADFLRVEVSREKLGRAPALLITLTIGFLVSTLEFSGIAKFLGPILEAVYPALIVLTVVNIGYKFAKLKSMNQTLRH